MKEYHIVPLLALFLLCGCRKSESDRPTSAQEISHLPDRRKGIEFDGPYWPLSSDRSFNYRFRFKNGEGIERVNLKETGVLGQSVYYGIAAEDEAEVNAIIGSVLPGLGAYRITDRGIETAEAFWSEDLSDVSEDDFQLLLALPLSIGAETVVTAKIGGQSLTVRVIGFEDISVAAGVFSNCAKIQINDVWSEGNSYVSTFWLAQGVGVVKWIKGTGRVEELVSFETPFEQR